MDFSGLLNAIIGTKTEPPKTKRSYDAGFFRGTATATGKNVTPETSLTIAAVYACVRVISEAVASLPLIVYERQDNGGKRRAYESPLYTLLHDSPNEVMTSFEYRETIQAHLLLYGNALSEIDYNGRGGINQIWPLDPSKVHQVKRNGNQLFYHYERPNHKLEWISGDRVWHLRGLGSNGIWGYSPIQLMRQSLGISLATDEFAGRFFGNGANMSGILKHPGVLSDDAFDRVQSSWASSYGGVSNAHKTAILEEGMEYERVSIPPEDAQFLQTRQFQVTEVARIYNVPPHKIQDLTRSTNNNIEQQSLDFVINTIRPWLVRWEQSIQQNLMLSRQRGRYFAEFLVDGLLRGDAKTRHETYAIGRQNGYYSANDVLEMENRNPIDGGDVYLVPLNMVPANAITDEQPTDNQTPTQPQADTPENIESDKGLNGAQIKAAIDILNGVVSGTVAASVAVELLISLGIDRDRAEKMVQDTISGGLVDVSQDSVRALIASEAVETRAKRSAASRTRLVNEFVPVFTEIMQRSVRREVTDVKRQAKKTIGKDDLAAFLLWLPDYYEQHTKYMDDSLAPIFNAYAGAIIRSVKSEMDNDDTIMLDSFIAAYLDTYTNRYSAKQQKYILAEIERTQAEGGDVLTAVESKMDEYDETRAEQEANRETRRMNNAIALAAYGAIGLTVKRWATVKDSCPYCNKLNGRTISINENFATAGDAITADGVSPLPITANIGHPPAHDGCDCMVVAG